MELLDRHFDISVQPVAGMELSEASLRGVERFLFEEAQLLDERRFSEWLALWTPDGRYWVPRTPGQANPFDEISLFWEDAMLRQVRVRRLENPRNWSQQPATRGCRMLGNISVQGVDRGGHLIVRSTLQLTEWRRTQRQLAGAVFHKLAAMPDGGWRMVLKRVDLVNCDDWFACLEVFI